MTSSRIRIARRLRATQTSAEEILWKHLRGRRFEGIKFCRQQPIAGAVVDFCCIELGLTIELDGIHHAEQKGADATRGFAIERHGFLELRFDNDEVVERLDWVMQEIGRAIDIARVRDQRAPFPRFEP